MKSFTYERATSPAEAAASITRVPGAKFIAGGTNLLDLMKLQVETPTHLVDVNGLALDTIEPRRRGAYGSAPWCATPIWRRHAGAARLRRAEPGSSVRCLGPITEQGDHGRQSASANPLPLLL